MIWSLSLSLSLSPSVSPASRSTYNYVYIYIYIIYIDVYIYIYVCVYVHEYYCIIYYLYIRTHDVYTDMNCMDVMSMLNVVCSAFVLFTLPKPLSCLPWPSSSEYPEPCCNSPFEQNREAQDKDRL